MSDVMCLEPADIQGLLPLLERWKAAATSRAMHFGVILDCNTALDTFRAMATSPNAEVLAVVHSDHIVGFMGLYLQPYHLGPQIMAHECCMYVLPEHRSAGLRLIRAAEKWAVAKGANHLVTTASRLAGDADRAGMFFKACGMLPFEDSFIKEVR